MRKVFKYITPVFAVAVVSVTGFVIYRELRNYQLDDISNALRSIPAVCLLLSGLATIVNYAVLTLYDFFALKYTKTKLSYPRIALTSFVACVFANNVGASVFGSAAMRFRLYGLFGIQPAVIVRIIIFTTVTLWLGLLFATGTAIAASGLPTSLFSAGAFFNGRMVGYALLAIVAAYLACTAFIRRDFTFRSQSINFPSIQLGAAQVIISAMDWLLMAFACYILLPVPVPFGIFLAAFLGSAFLGIASHVPGGIGVFETVMILTLKPWIDAGSLIASLCAFRIIYYLLPLLAGALFYLCYELALRFKLIALSATKRNLAAFFSITLPPFFALLIFLAGTVLLLQEALPLIPARLKILETILPHPIVEASHFLGSIAGALLIVMAYGLLRRIDAAYTVTVFALLCSSVLSLINGFHYELAALLLLLFFILAPAKRLFHRNGMLFSEPFSVQWLTAVILTVASMFWVGFFSYKNVAYSDSLWLRLAPADDAARFLRAGSAAAIITLIGSFAFLLARVGSRNRTVEIMDKDLVSSVLSSATRADANLALLGDKKFLFDEKNRAAIMFGISGSSYIAMGDPFGEPVAARELIWRLHQMASHEGLRTAFYRVRNEFLPVYLETGLSIVKFGEEAIVDCAGFTLDGSAHRTLRYTYNKVVRDGYEFSVIEPPETKALLDDFSAISDSWLVNKNAREKRFSMGRFIPEYLTNFRCAIIKNNGRIIAFANLWESGGKKEVSPDLMRYIPDAPHGIMDFLFVEIIRWAKNNNYAVCNLGLAPLAGIENRPAAPLWNRFAALVFNRGGYFYNFNGLRQFKAKFATTWEPTYLAITKGLSVPATLIDIATLISNGKKGLFSK